MCARSSNSGAELPVMLDLADDLDRLPRSYAPRHKA